MADKRELGRCQQFLGANGWKYSAGDPGAFHRSGCSSIELSLDEIVFIGDGGDYLHLPMNYFVLVGALMEMRQIDAAYASVPAK